MSQWSVAVSDYPGWSKREICNSNNNVTVISLGIKLLEYYPFEGIVFFLDTPSTV